VNANPGVNLNYVARWNGATWSPLVGAMDNWVHCLATNQVLFAGGSYTAAGSTLANRVARWSDTTCAADTNGDHVVNVDDLLSVISGWGACP